MERRTLKSAARKLARGLDPLLLGRGFTRKGLTWNRRTAAMADIVDVVDLQVTKSGDAVFVNIGVADASVYATLWERPLPEFVLEPASTIRTRLGPLFADTDVLWDLADSLAVDDIARRLESHGLPFLDRMHDIGQVAEYLKDEPGLAPVEKIGVAVVLSRAGDRDGACAILERLAGLDPRHARIQRLIAEIGCGG